MVGKKGSIYNNMKQKINLIIIVLLLNITVNLFSCKQGKNKDGDSFTLIGKDDYYIEYSTLEIYREVKTKTPLNGYYVIGNKTTKWEEFNVEKGLLNGEYLFYHPNGNVSIKSNYVKGRIQGEEIYYYPNGAIQQKHTYVNQVIHGEKIHYYEGGQIKSKAVFENGKSDNHTGYDLVGNITSQTFVKDGLSINQVIKKGKVFSENISSTYDDYEAMKFYNVDGSLKHHLRMLEENGVPIIIELDENGNEKKRINLKENSQEALKYMQLLMN